MVPVKKIVSGGQTGVDRAALDYALKNQIACGGWCPKGRLAEDGKIAEVYPLTETNTPRYSERTELNARDSDGTLVITKGQPKGGTAWTIESARKHKKPLLVVDMNHEIDRKKFEEWLAAHRIEILNIAGPRESFCPGEIYALSYRTLSHLLGRPEYHPAFHAAG